MCAGLELQGKDFLAYRCLGRLGPWSKIATTHTAMLVNSVRTPRAPTSNMMQTLFTAQTSSSYKPLISTFGANTSLIRMLPASISAPTSFLATKTAPTLLTNTKPPKLILYHPHPLGGSSYCGKGEAYPHK